METVRVSWNSEEPNGNPHTPTYFCGAPSLEVQMGSAQNFLEID